MSLFGFGKKTQHKRFDYIPRFYNPEKEELQNRLKQYDELNDAELSKVRIKSGLRNRHRGNADFKKSQEKKSNIRLLSIIFILILVTYMIFKSDKFLQMIESFNG